MRVSARAFPKNKESSYELPFKILTKEDLEIEDIDSILGECYLESSLNSLSVLSQNFKISNKINLDAKMDKTDYNPGETIIIKINSTKENGQEHLGEVILLNNTIVNTPTFNSGILELEIGEKVFSGTYVLNLITEDEVGNKGTLKKEIIINQIPSEVSFGVNSFEIMPGNNLSITLEIKDQSGEAILTEQTIKIKSPEKIISEMILNTGEITSIVFPNNSSSGKWILSTTVESLEEEIEINVQQKPFLESSLNEDILTIKNIGNYLYEDYFEITIGEVSESIFLRLKKNEIKQFKLSAPEGDYQILFRDSNTVVEGSSFLTGNAISVDSLGNQGNFYKNYLWLFLILILGTLGVILIRKNPKTKTLNPLKFAKNVKHKTSKKYLNRVARSINFTNKSPKVQSIDSSNYHSTDSTMKDLTIGSFLSAESSLVLSGEKIKSSILVLKIKNYQQLKEYAREKLENLIRSEKNKNVLIDKRENYIFFIFSPKFTKTYKNEILAARYGFKLLESLKEFNKKFKDKISFNMGINIGDLVISETKGKIKYTALGNAISFPKRLSDSSDAKIIITDEIRKKLLRELKVEKNSTINENQTFSIISITDKKANQEKLKEILKRM